MIVIVSEWFLNFSLHFTYNLGSVSHSMAQQQSLNLMVGVVQRSSSALETLWLEEVGSGASLMTDEALLDGLAGLCPWRRVHKLPVEKSEPLHVSTSASVIKSQCGITLLSFLSLHRIAFTNYITLLSLMLILSLTCILVGIFYTSAVQTSSKLQPTQPAIQQTYNSQCASKTPNCAKDDRNKYKWVSEHIWGCSLRVWGEDWLLRSRTLKFKSW